jgi:hypothetical protein
VSNPRGMARRPSRGRSRGCSRPACRRRRRNQDHCECIGRRASNRDRKRGWILERRTHRSSLNAKPSSRPIDLDSDLQRGNRKGNRAPREAFPLRCVRPQPHRVARSRAALASMSPARTASRRRAGTRHHAVRKCQASCQVPPPKGGWHTWHSATAPVPLALNGTHTALALRRPGADPFTSERSVLERARRTYGPKRSEAQTGTRVAPCCGPSRRCSEDRDLGSLRSPPVTARDDEA